MSSEWKAFGETVPTNRLCRGLECVRAMIPNISTEKAFTIVGKCAKIIERDQPFEIVGALPPGLDKDIATIDLTGRYRLLATMLTD